jgi:cytochrome c peroxidase
VASRKIIQILYVYERLIPMFKRFSSGSFGLCFSVTVLLLAGCGGGSGGGGGGGFTSGVTKAELGRKIFIDTDLSSSRNQSCASCHDLSAPNLNGFADPDPDVTKTAPVSEGSEEDVGAFGNRNAPTVSYASFIPDFGTLTAAGVAQSGDTPSKYRGGQFLDGRALNLVEQAKGPFLNPVEMNLSTKAVVVARVAESNYANDFIAVYGSGAFDNTNTAFDNIADAIAAFEKTAELNPFSSKYDAFIRDRGNNPLSIEEANGLALFKDETRAKCTKCHTLNDSTDAVPSDSLFTNFEYYNIGVPVNLDNPSYPTVDKGLGGGGNLAVEPADITAGTEDGKFRVPTLRNVGVTGPYMHNGAHATLEEVINHYDQFGTDNITPEVATNIANEMGDVTIGNSIGLTVEEVADIKAFLLTLTDGYQ